MDLPDNIEDEAQLNELLARPSDALIQLMAKMDGDLMILGVAGKMGVSLAHLAANAIQLAGVNKKVYGVARFSSLDARRQLDSLGVETIACDLLDRAAVSSLPRVRNALFMAGRKFGTSGSQALTWAMNTIVPANVIEHFRQSRIVAFSTGCVYPLPRSKAAGEVRLYADGTWCLDPQEKLSSGQAEEIDRVIKSYPHLNDDAFVQAHIDRWLS